MFWFGLVSEVLILLGGEAYGRPDIFPPPLLTFEAVAACLEAVVGSWRFAPGAALTAVISKSEDSSSVGVSSKLMTESVLEARSCSIWLFEIWTSPRGQPGDEVFMMAVLAGSRVGNKVDGLGRLASITFDELMRHLSCSCGISSGM